MLSRLFFVTNFLILVVVFSLKTYYETSFDWFYALPWLTFLNGFIDIAIKSEIESNIILTFWFVFSTIWLFFLVKETNLFGFNKKKKKISPENNPLDIDELKEKYNQSYGENKEQTEKKVFGSPESAGASFAAALSQAVSTNSTGDNSRNLNSSFFDQANQALSSMTPDAAKKLRRVQTILNDLEAAAKSDDLIKVEKNTL